MGVSPAGDFGGGQSAVFWSPIGGGCELRPALGGKEFLSVVVAEAIASGTLMRGEWKSGESPEQTRYGD